MKKTKTWRYIRRATRREKAHMQQIILDENEFQQIEPHGWNAWGETCPIHFRMEKHNAWQMQAYQPDGVMMNGFHESFIRCQNCGAVLTYGGEDCNPYCHECKTELA